MENEIEKVNADADADVNISSDNSLSSENNTPLPSDTSNEQANPQKTEANPLDQQEIQNRQVPEEQDTTLDFSSYTKEYTETGSLSDESYSNLEKNGITKDMIGFYIEGQKVAINNLKESVGGEDVFNKILSWAPSNLSQEEIAAYNKHANTGDFSGMQLVLAGIAAKYREANGYAPKETLTGDSTASTPNGYSCREEMLMDMKNPLYMKDESYRAKVMEKIARSTLNI